MDADVAVVGTGTMGSMALWRLARAGARVVGFEQFGIGHDRSAAGGGSRIFRDAPSAAYREGPAYVPILRRAGELYRELEAASGQDLLTLTGTLMIGTEHCASMRRLTDSVRELGRAHDVLDAEAMARRFPQHRLRPGEIALLDHHAGFVRPERAVVAAVSVARALGATVLPHTRVTAVDSDADGVVVRTADGGSHRARQAVVAAGPWSSRFVPELAGALTTYRLVQAWYAPRDPAAYTPDRFPVFTRESSDVHLYGVPTLDGRSVKVGPHATFGTVGDADALDRRVTPAEVGALDDAVAELLPGLVPEPVRTAACMDVYTPDLQSVVGAMPGVPHVWLLAGFSSHGFKIAPAIGQIAAELVLHGTSTLPVAQFDPAR